jgi:phospholipid/cholesterol/gamma-HCH transport system substrate-binding protein
MNKQAPSIGQLFTLSGFVLACFGLLLFVWVAFGGPTPLAASGYKLSLPMTQIGQLAEQSQIKISGVEIGRVNGVQLGEGDQDAEAIVTLEIDPEYAPVPQDTRAILRAKSLLGEAYVELTPGDPRNGMAPDGGELAAAQVAKSVQLDEIFRTFDEKTREAFKQGAVDNSIAVNGRGATLNQMLGVLPGTLTELDDVLNILNQQEEDVSKLIRNTGVVFDALSARQGELSSLITNTNTVFTTTASRTEDLKEFFRIFPTFLRESRLTQERLGEFSEVGTPVMRKMVPVANQVKPLFDASQALDPQLIRLYTNIKPVINKAPRAFPSLRGFLDEEAPKLLGRLPDYLSELNPLLQTASYYKKELAAFLGNASTALNARATYPTNPDGVRYIRAGVRLGPESATAYDTRLNSGRSNPYPAAGSSLDFAGAGLQVFNDANCTGAGINTTMPPYAALTPVQQAQYSENLRYVPDSITPAEAEEQYNNVIQFGFAGFNQTDNVPTPACIQQPLYDPIGDTSKPPQQYQQVFRQP